MWFFLWGLGALMLFFPEFILRLMTTDQPVIAEGAHYSRIICFSYPVFAVSQILMIMLRSVETVKISFYLSIVTFVVNVTLNYLLIFGNSGFPELGSRGAADCHALRADTGIDSDHRIHSFDRPESESAAPAYPVPDEHGIAA